MLARPLVRRARLLSLRSYSEGHDTSFLNTSPNTVSHIPHPQAEVPSIFSFFAIVPQQKAYVVETFGKFDRVLAPGLHFLIPWINRVSYVHSMKEEAFPIPNQMAITRDNVTINIDGVLYVRVVDPHAASYGVENPVFAVTQLAQTTMRSELGKITLDKTFEERESLNENIVNSINKAGKAWGIECLRYEIRDIAPPTSVKHAMDLQAGAERKKRAMILDSEGLRQSEVNRAEGEKLAAILDAEGAAEAIVRRAEASAKGISVLAAATRLPGGKDAISLQIAEQYVASFGKIAKESTTLLLPSNTGDAASMVAQALTMFKRIGSGQPVPTIQEKPVQEVVQEEDSTEQKEEEETKYKLMHERNE